jgi:hypothetical protein
MAENRAADKLAKGARENETKQGTTRVAENPASLADHGIDKHLEGAPARRRHGQSSPRRFMSGKTRFWTLPGQAAYSFRIALNKLSWHTVVSNRVSKPVKGGRIGSER